MNGVFGLLVTGSNESLVKFHLSVFLCLNSLDRRKQTIRYTCMAEHLPMAIDAAKAADVTLQRIDIVGFSEFYPTLVRGDMLGWRPLATVAMDGAAAKAVIVGETKRRYRCKLEQSLDTPIGLYVTGETISVPKCNVQFVVSEDAEKILG